MGQTISIHKKNIYKTHRFTDKMYIKLNDSVYRNRATPYEIHFKNTIQPVFETTLNIPIFNFTYVPSGYCIVSRRLSQSHIIEVKAFRYNNQIQYARFVKGYARLKKNTIKTEYN
jgi:hypothetical protein